IIGNKIAVNDVDDVCIFSTERGETNIMKYPILSLVLIALLALPFASLAVSGDDNADDDLIGIEWTLVSIDGSPVIAGSTITLTLGAEDSDAFGTGGCNRYGAQYNIDGDDLSFDMVISTLMACMEDDITAQEAAYFEALSAITGYTLEAGRLTLTDDDGVRLVFNAPLSLETTRWQLVSIDGADVVTEETPTLIFDGEGVRGHSGCNILRTTYQTADDAITFAEVIRTTRRACADPAASDQENDYLEALADARSFALDHATLTIFYGDDERALVFVAVVDDLADTAWVLVSIGGADVVEGETPTLEFGGRDDVNGDTGCNVFRTTFQTVGASITFAPDIRTTRRACVDTAASDQERAYLQALTDAESFVLDDDTLTIFYGDDTLVFIAD
ncbi:MAG: META domain-containing protein, partial [Anaerolineaceae bacterium]